MKFRTLLSIVLLSASCAQVPFRKEIDPPSLNRATSRERGPHQVRSASAPRKELLVLTLGGTSSHPRDLVHLHDLAESLGYDVLGIDYPNNVITTTCRKSTAPLCFDQFRQEIAEGIDVSPHLKVDASNSLLARITAVLVHLRKVDSRWEAYHDGAQIRWDRIRLVGHSQGAGHAAYLSKRFRVDQVLMIGGPQDATERGLAPWLKTQGQTPASRYFALLHEKDFFKVDLQLGAVRALTKTNTPGIQIHISKRPTRDAHMDLIQPLFREEWKEFLEMPSTP